MPLTLSKTATSPNKEKEPNGEVYDFIISYDGQFVGHYRSRKRITNRTAFIKVARRLQRMIDGFGVDRLQIYKPVRLKVTRPESFSEIRDACFQWFPFGADSKLSPQESQVMRPSTSTERDIGRSPSSRAEPEPPPELDRAPAPEPPPALERAPAPAPEPLPALERAPASSNESSPRPPAKKGPPWVGMLGEWTVLVDLEGRQLSYAFHFCEKDGKLDAILKSPRSGSYPCDQVSFKHAVLKMKIRRRHEGELVNWLYEGTVFENRMLGTVVAKADGTLKGTWTAARKT